MTEVALSLIDIVRGWGGPGQGIFILALISAVSGTIVALAKFTAVIVRGWPPYQEENEDE